jgi:hypothetical protein
VTLTPVDRLRAICLALPEATEKIAWGEPTWRVRGKLFAQLDDHHHGAEHLAVWLPAPLGEQVYRLVAPPRLMASRGAPRPSPEREPSRTRRPVRTSSQRSR